MDTALTSQGSLLYHLPQRDSSPPPTSARVHTECLIPQILSGETIILDHKLVNEFGLAIIKIISENSFWYKHTVICQDYQCFQTNSSIYWLHNGWPKTSVFEL